MIKTEFSASLLQSSVSHDHSEMICCSRNTAYYKLNMLTNNFCCVEMDICMYVNLWFIYPQ